MVVRLFVTGTDTGVGKTEVASALLALMAQRGERPFALKPFESGGGNDSRILQVAAGGWQPLDTVCVYRFKAPLAPAIAARREGRRPSWARVLGALEALGSGFGVVEGAGGLFVPLDAHHDVVDLVAAYQLPVIVVARAGLGTINHTVLTLSALRGAGATVAAVVLVRATPAVDPSIRYNRPELERRFPGLELYGPLPYLANPKRRRRALMRELAPLVERPTLIDEVEARKGKK